MRIAYTILAAALIDLMSNSAAAQPPQPSNPDAPQTQCDPIALISALDKTIQLSPLEIALAASQDWDLPPSSLSGLTAPKWVAVRTRSLERITEYAKCPPSDVPPLPNQALYRQLWSQHETTIAEATKVFNPTSPVLSPVLGPSGVPAPQPLVIGLSQVFSAGQPGWLAAISGTPASQSDSTFLRHVSISGSGLLIQPPPSTSTESKQPNPVAPEIASLDIALSYSSRRTSYDWVNKVTAQQPANNRALNQLGWNATKGLITGYTQGIADNQSSRDALSGSVHRAKTDFRDATETYWTDTYIRAEQQRDYDSHIDLALRVRVSPSPKYVPELPDLLSAGAQFAGEQRFGDPRATIFGSFAWDISASFSACPRSAGISLLECQIAATANGLFDASAGFVALFPSPLAGSPARVRASGLVRATPRENQLGNADISAGGTFGVEVPVGVGVVLVGTYTARWIRDVGVQGTSALTFAKAIK